MKCPKCKREMYSDKQKDFYQCPGDQAARTDSSESCGLMLSREKMVEYLKLALDSSSLPIPPLYEI